jgi:hypothetical protein
MPNNGKALGRLRNFIDDPFAVRWNTETTAGESLFTFDPTPGAYMYNWDHNVCEDAEFAISAGFVFRHLPTTMDAHTGFLDAREFLTFGISVPAEDLYEAHARIVSKLSPELRILGAFYYGNGQAQGDSRRLVTDRFKANLNVFYKKFIINGDFENGSEGWITRVDDDVSSSVVAENNNSFYEVNILNPNPNQAFLVNVSQKIAITQDRIYILTLKAWSDRDRALIAGTGLSGGNFLNGAQTVNITDTRQQFELTLSSQKFGALDARVLFDTNRDVGLVRIDNVSLNLQ